ncbi:MAG: cellulase family glycosylhydrolase [Anaerolineae bacterium]|nr:cellulase family glycosylhydrolase [Anaerolineae bacterium]
MRFKVIGAVLVGILLMVGSVLAQGNEQGVSDERYAHLARGLNLTTWFWYAPPDPMSRYAAGEFEMLHEMGFTFMRVPIDLGFLLDESEDMLHDEHLAMVDQGIQQLHAAGLAVIIDLHSTSIDDSNAANYSGALEDPAFVEVFSNFWRNFAAHLSQYDSETTFFQLMNEPVFYDNPGAWVPILTEVAAAAREGAPEHTLIANTARWSSIETLVALTPLDDPNIIYDFHFYEPFPFTHQGATWSMDEVASLRDIPYPSSPETLAPFVERAFGDSQREMLLNYGEERWDRQAVADYLQPAFDWAREHGVRVINTEFGVYQPYAPAADRASWIQDTRETFEANGIGWAMWDYDTNFGMALPLGNHILLIPDVVAALGVQMPENCPRCN